MHDARDKVLWADEAFDLESFPARRRRRPGDRQARIDLDPDAVERGLVQLVLTVVELLRQLMERQALRRVEHGTLTEEEEERVGTALMRLAETMDDLKHHFGLADEDLNLHLGPLGNLL